MAEAQTTRDKAVDWLTKQGLSTVLLVAFCGWMVFKEQYVWPARMREMHEQCEKLHTLYAEGYAREFAAIRELIKPK